MKNLTKIAMLALVFNGFMHAMEPAQVIIEEYQPVTDRAQVEQILRDKWAQQVWGEKGKTFDQNFADILLNPEEPAPSKKFISIARDVSQPIDSSIKGYITYIARQGDPKSANHGYIELVALKDMSANAARKALETKLIQHALNKLREYNPEKVVTYTFKNDNFEIDLLRDIGFKQADEGKEWRLFALPIQK